MFRANPEVRCEKLYRRTAPPVRRIADGRAEPVVIGRAADGGTTTPGEAPRVADAGTVVATAPVPAAADAGRGPGGQAADATGEGTGHDPAEGKSTAGQATDSG